MNNDPSVTYSASAIEIDLRRDKAKRRRVLLRRIIRRYRLFMQDAEHRDDIVFKILMGIIIGGVVILLIVNLYRYLYL